MLTKLLLIVTKSALQFTKSRVLNMHTSKGVALLVSAGIGFGYLKEQDANLIITLLSGIDITWTSIYILCINVAIFYIAFRGIRLFLRMSDCYFEEKIINKGKKDNTEDNK